MSRCGESMHQPIIPGLPDDLGIRCLAMLSHGHHGVMEAVSKRWRDVMRSEEYANCKAREGWCGDWLFVLTRRALDQWMAYDPEADRWHPLPLTPYWMDVQGCHCACNKLLVIGYAYGRRDTRRVESNVTFQFDPFKKEWSRAASMRTPRFYFASCAMDGKVYVAGGQNPSDYPEGMNLAEVYDPLTDKWEDLPPMPVPIKLCTGIAYESKFNVCDEIRQTVIFDPLSRSWKVKHERWSPSRNEVAVTDDQVYLINILRSTVERRDAEKDEHDTVGEVPSEGPSVFFNVRLASLGYELYVVRCKFCAMKDPQAGETGDLDRVRICDATRSPLIWREIRPVCLNLSAWIKGWATLKQQ